MENKLAKAINNFNPYSQINNLKSQLDNSTNTINNLHTNLVKTERKSNKIVKSLQQSLVETQRRLETMEKSSRALTGDAKSMSNVGGRVTYEVDPALIVSYYLRDPFIRAGIRKKISKVLANSYSIEPVIGEDETESNEADRQKEDFEEWSKTCGGINPKVNFDRILKNICSSLFIGDMLFLELVYKLDPNLRPIINSPPDELHVLDWEDMNINTDEYGTLKELKVEKGVRQSGAYHQVWNGATKAIFDKSEILYTNYEVAGNRKYGESLIKTILHAAANKAYAETFAGMTFMNQKPKGLFEIDQGDDDFLKTKKQILDGKENPASDLFTQTSGKIKYTVLSTPQDMQFVEFIKQSRYEMLVGIGASSGSVYLPGETGGWGADVEHAEMGEDASAFQDFLAHFVNENIFPLFGWNKIKIRFNKVDLRMMEKKVDIAQKARPFLTKNEIRLFLGYPEVEDGDVFEEAISPFNNPNQFPSKEGTKEPHEEAVEMEGIGKGEKERSVAKAISVTKAKIKNPYFWRKDYNEVMSKSISRKVRKKIKQIDNLLNLRKDYANEMTNILIEYIDFMKGIVEARKINEMKKAVNPTKDFKELDDFRNQLVIKIKEVGRKYAVKAYTNGFEFGANEVGFPLAKSSIDTDAIEFLKDWNIDLTEGALSEASGRAKTAIRIGIENQESISEIVARLDNEKSSIEKTYKNRFQTIARTEVARAQTEGRINAYKKSGVINKIQILVGTGPDDMEICANQFNAAPGTLSAPIDLNGFIPPPTSTHPNCLCSVIPYIE